MKFDSEKSNGKKRAKDIGCGCLTILILGFILIGIFAEDPNKQNQNLEPQKIAPAVEKKIEQPITETTPNTPPTTKAEDDTKNNSEAEKLQDIIDGYYEKAAKMNSRAEAIISAEEILKEDQKKALIDSLIKEYFSFYKEDPQKAVESQVQYLRERENALERCAKDVNNLTEKQKECLGKVLSNNGNEGELKRINKKLKLSADLYKQIQQDCVMQEALLKLKKAAFDLLVAAGGDDYFEELEKAKEAKEKNIEKILSSVVIKTKLRVNSKNNYSGTPKFTFTIANNSKRYLSLVGGDMTLKTRDDETLIKEKDIVLFFAEKKDVTETKVIAPGETRTFTATEKEITLIQDGWDQLLLVNNYVLDFNIKRVRFCDSFDTPSKGHDEYDIDE